MPAKTTTDLVYYVLMNVMAVVDAGETPSAIDHRDTINAYSLVYAELVDDSIAYWPEESIPEVAMHNVAKIVANRLAGAFGIPSNEDVEFIAKRNLKKHISIPIDGIDVPGQYF